MLRPKLNRLWGNTSAVVRRDPGDAKYIQGWLAEIPTYQVLNYLQWKTDATFLALAERGVFEWGGDVAYQKGAAAWDETDRAIYVALVSNPDTSLTPSKNDAQWSKSSIQITRKSYDDAVAAITSHIADVTGNPHKLTPGRLGTYTVAQIDALVAQYRALVAAHSQDKNNPHGVKAKDIGAVPVEGGSYTGNVAMQTGQLFLDAAGTKKVKADDAGVYLANASGQVGVDSTGRGYVKTGTLPSSTIITESSFADNKAIVEPDYAVPQPVFYLPLASDLNLYIGKGVVNYGYTGTGPTSDWNPAALDGITIGSNPSYEQYMTFSSHLEGMANATIAIDVFLNASVQSGSGEEIYYSFGSASGCLLLEFHTNNTVCAWTVSSAKTSNVGLIAGAWNRVVAVRTATQLKLFLNGALMATLSNNNPTVTGTDFNFIRAAKQGTALRTSKLRNVRAWGAALTDKQVSTL